MACSKQANRLPVFLYLERSGEVINFLNRVFQETFFSTWCMLIFGHDSAEISLLTGKTKLAEVVDILSILTVFRWI